MHRLCLKILILLQIRPNSLSVSSSGTPAALVLTIIPASSGKLHAGRPCFQPVLLHAVSFPEIPWSVSTGQHQIFAGQAKHGRQRRSLGLHSLTAHLNQKFISLHQCRFCFLDFEDRRDSSHLPEEDNRAIPGSISTNAA